MPASFTNFAGSWTRFTGRGGGAWTPSNLSGSDRSWWSAKDLVLADAAAVEAITARLGATILEQATSSAKPTYRAAGVNSLPSVQFATDDFLTADGAAAAFGGDDTPFSWFGVIAPTLDANARSFWSLGASGAASSLDLRHPSSPTSTMRFAGANQSDLAGAFTTTVAVAVGLVYTGVATNLWANLALSSTTAHAETTFATERYTLGCRRRSTNSQFFNGHWCEHFHTAGVAVSDAEAIQALTYLMTEWGIT